MTHYRIYVVMEKKEDFLKALSNLEGPRQCIATKPFSGLIEYSVDLELTEEELDFLMLSCDIVAAVEIDTQIETIEYVSGRLFEM